MHYHFTVQSTPYEQSLGTGKFRKVALTRRNCNQIPKISTEFRVPFVSDKLHVSISRIRRQTVDNREDKIKKGKTDKKN